MFSPEEYCNEDLCVSLKENGYNESKPTLYEARKWIEKAFKWRIEVYITCGGKYTYQLYNLSTEDCLKRDLDMEIDLYPNWNTEEEALADAVRMTLIIGEAKK